MDKEETFESLSLSAAVDAVIFGGRSKSSVSRDSNISKTQLWNAVERVKLGGDCAAKRRGRPDCIPESVLNVLKCSKRELAGKET